MEGNVPHFMREAEPIPPVAALVDEVINIDFLAVACREGFDPERFL